MANVLLHQKALALRKLGKSYGQIKNELGVGKSTLSGWLREHPLSDEQVRFLRDGEVRIEKYRQTMRLKRERKLHGYYKEAKGAVLPLSKRELFLSGLFLYWGEGGKTERGTISISNTDPSVLKFTLYWMREALDIPKEKIKALLHLYDDMVIEEAVEFWSKTLNMPRSQFSKPYIKKSKRSDLDEKGYGHGTCMLRVCSTEIKDRTLMAIKAIADYSEDYIQKVVSSKTNPNSIMFGYDQKTKDHTRRKG